MLNIPSYIDDPSYRYKMPALQLKIEGRGNGIKTKIVNLNELATALRVPPAYPLKFMGYELGSQTNESQSVVNGSFVEPEMRKHLDKFIEKYVLCSNCKYPEMVLKIKHGAVGGSCNSCGTRSTLDNTHKLAAYILKNPPKDSSEFKGDKSKDAVKKGEKGEKGKDEKGKDEKDDKKHGKHPEKEAHHDKKGDHKKTEDKKEEEEKDETKTGGEKAKDTASQFSTFKELEDDLIHKARQAYEKHANVETFDEKPTEVKKIINGIREIVPAEHITKLPYILFNAIFDMNIAKEVGKNKAIISQAYEELGTPDYEFDLLLNLEKFLLVKNDSSTFEKYVPTILKFFYDEDLLTEEFLLDWEKGKYNTKFIMDFRYQKPVDERFKAASKPILDWLKEEEGEDKENGEGEDSDVDIDNI